MSNEIIPKNEFLSESMYFDKIDYVEKHFKVYINDLITNPTYNIIETRIRLVVSIIALLNYNYLENLQIYYLKRFSYQNLEELIKLCYNIKNESFIEYYYDYLIQLNKYQLIYYKQNYIQYINSSLIHTSCLYIFDSNSYISNDFNKQIWTDLYYKLKKNNSINKKTKLDYINIVIPHISKNELFENNLYYIISRIYNEINKLIEKNENVQNLVLDQCQIVLFVNLLIYENNNNNDNSNDMENFNSYNKKKIFMLSLLKDQLLTLY